MNQLEVKKVNSFVSLRLGHKAIKDLPTNTVKRECVDILTTAYFDNGSPLNMDAKEDAGVLQFQTEALFKELSGKYGTLTLPELSEAFRRGVRGESGAFFGMCPKTYHQFIKYFFDLPERGKAWMNYLEELETPRAKAPIVLTHEHLQGLAIRTFEEYKLTKDLPQLGSVCGTIYDTIKKSQKVETLIDRLDWAEIKKLAKESYVNEMKRGTKKGDLKKLLDMLIYDISNRSFEFHVKKVGLKFYFDALIKNDKSLELQTPE